MENTSSRLDQRASQLLETCWTFGNAGRRELWRARCVAHHQIASERNDTDFLLQFLDYRKYGEMTTLRM